jgi:hypothetical protein
MKKMNIILIFAILCLTNSFSHAAKWRVNNTGIAANFTTASEAVNSPLVLAGDTLYFESSMVSYGGVNITKKLVLIGPGYFLGENDSTQADTKPSTLSSTSFNMGSQGSIVQGLSFDGNVVIGTSGITLEKNSLMAGLQITSGSGNVVLRNYILYMNLSITQNVLISNNIIVSTNPYGNCMFVQPDASATVINNIMLGMVSVNNTIFRNNILVCTNLTPLFTSSNSTIENNIGASTQFDASNGNQQNVDMTTVFMYTGSSDGKYRLKPGSPAIAAGVGGTDCGVFGGNYPYVLSGMVSGPSVWYLNMNGMDVTVKAKSH